MSVQTGRVVSADEARETVELGEQGFKFPPWHTVELAHTVIVQAEQIAAVRALAERWQSVASDVDGSTLTPTVAAIFEAMAGCGDSILKALGVSGE